MNPKRIAAAVAGAALVVLASASGAFASYEGPTIDLTVTPSSVIGGEGSFSGTASSNEDCSSWQVSFAGPSDDAPATGTGTSIDFTFSTNAVSDITPATITAVCTFDATPRAKDVQHLTRSADVTVNPASVSPPIVTPGSNGGGGFLADTGGPHLWLAIGGVLLTLIGAGAVIRGRRVSA